MCKYGPRFFVGYKFLATYKKSERQRDKQMTGQTEANISKNYHATRRSNKTDKIIIVAEETVFMQIMTVLPPIPIIFCIKQFYTEVQFFLSSCPELKFTHKC